MEQVPGRTCGPMERGANAEGFLAALVTMLEQSAPGRLHPMEGAHVGTVCEELQPMGRTQVREVCEGLSHGRDPMLEQ